MHEFLKYVDAFVVEHPIITIIIFVVVWLAGKIGKNIKE